MYVSHEIKAGDTIHKIAYAYGVSWMELAQLNGLSYPYIDSNAFSRYLGVETVATRGEKILIPTVSSQPSVIRRGNNKDIENLAFGRDLAVAVSTDEETSLEAVFELLSDESYDLKTSDGLANLSQSLRIRLGTPKGSLPLHPEFGSNILRFIGKKMNADTLTKIRLDIQETILADDRVYGVGSVTANFDSGVLRVLAEVKPIDPYEKFTLNAEYQY